MPGRYAQRNGNKKNVIFIIYQQNSICFVLKPNDACHACHVFMHVMYVIALCMYAAMLLGPLTLPRLLDGSLDLGPGFGGSNPESIQLRAAL